MKILDNIINEKIKEKLYEANLSMHKISAMSGSVILSLTIKTTMYTPGVCERFVTNKRRVLKSFIKDSL